MSHGVVDEVFSLLESAGAAEYFGEAVSKLEHSIQCAWQAGRAGADEELVLAALLHDIGHLLDDDAAVRDARVGVVNHDQIGERWLLSHGFSPRLARLVGGHVDAKRYLTSASAAYLDHLSPASRETLSLQGGPMSADQAQRFVSQPEMRDMLRLRSWDEMAKDPDWIGPGLESYREMMVRHLAAGIV